MILTLRSSAKTIHIEISIDHFKQLRNPSISSDEIEKIAFSSNINPSLLHDYVKDLQHSIQEITELDGSCDYSDHL